jgi:hypothetical protein
MSLHESNFLIISQLPEIDGIKIQWLADSEKMLEDDFKREILGEKRVVEEIKPKVIFANALQMKYAIAPLLQEWHNEQIFPAFMSAEVRKLAVLVSADVFVQVAIEQLVEDGSGKELITKYFEDEHQAMNWLKI